MSVCLAVKTNDCLVFAADSASTIYEERDGKAAIVNVFNHSSKVFNLYRGRPVGGMTAGMGNFGRLSVSHILKQFREELSAPRGRYCIDGQDFTMKQVAEMAYAYIYEDQFKTHREEKVWESTFYIGGYSTAADYPELWKVAIDVNGNCAEPVLEGKEEDKDLYYAGDSEALTRILEGHSERLAEVLKTAGVAPAAIPSLVDHIEAECFAKMSLSTMPVIDAIELATFLVEAAKGYDRFIDGANTIGGPVDTATMTRHEGFKWIRRKRFYPAELNGGYRLGQER